MGITFWDKIKEFNKPKHIIIFIITFMIAYLILMTSLITKKYDLSAGDIAKADIKATREVQDETATKEKIKAAEDSVALLYSRIDVRTPAENNIKYFVARVNSINESNKEEKDRIAAMKNDKTFSNLNDNNLGVLAKMSKDDMKGFQDNVISILTEVLNAQIEDDQEVLKKTRENVAAKVNNSSIDKNLKDTASVIAQAQVRFNYFYDKDKTEEAKKNAAKNVDDVMVKKDQIVVKEGEPVTEAQIAILRNLGLLDGNSKLAWYIYVSLGALVFTVIVLQWYYLYRYYNKLFKDSSKLMLLSILSCIALILARSLSLISPYLIPFACVPMLITLLIDSKISITVSVINCILISGMVGFNIEITLLALLNSVLGSILLKKMQARNDILYSAFFIAVLNVVITFSMGVLLSNNITEVLKKSGFSFIGAIVSAVLTIGFLPFFESTFDIITTIKLLELSNPNETLLKQLLIEAPGTYHHSILVANLAEVAAEEVGGNPVLARVGAYYHDVGKIKRPYFFKENQIGNDNPHSKITPNLSTLVITSHVKDGIELAKQSNLPRVLRDIIEQHHGTSLVKYFYLTMKNSCTNPEDIKEEDFRYSGPIPDSKESAIIMLADSIEAAVRSINEPNRNKIEEMVNGIIKDRLNDGQLDNCDLTLKDLNKIKNAFIKSLMGIYHHRIEYPTDKWEEKKLLKE